MISRIMSDSLNNIENPLLSAIIHDENMESQIQQSHRENLRVDFERALEDMHTLLDAKNFVFSSNFHEEFKERCAMIFRRLFQKVNVTIDRNAEQKKNNIKGAMEEYEVVRKKLSQKLDESQKYMDYLDTTVGEDLVRTKTLLEHQENVIQNMTGEIDLLTINTELAMQESRRRNGAL